MSAKTRIRRFTPVQRFFHVLLILSFLTQGATGLARLYIASSWGKSLAGVFGGYEACRTIHIYVGIFLMCIFVAHILYVLTRINWKELPAAQILFFHGPRISRISSSISAGFWVLPRPRSLTAGATGKNSITGPCFGDSPPGRHGSTAGLPFDCNQKSCQGGV